MENGASAKQLPANKYSSNHEVYSEIGNLKRIIIHAPDPGISAFPPRAMHDLLYDDVVDYDKICAEYCEYLELLYWFLDPEKIRSFKNSHERTRGLPSHFDPASDDYLRSDKVMDVQDLLVQAVSNKACARELVAAVCGLEGLGSHCQSLLLALSPKQLAATLVNGMMPGKGSTVHRLFTPATNLIFTRDTAVAIGDHLFVTRPKKRARARESLLVQYIFEHFLLGGDSSKLLQLDALVHDFYPDFKTNMTIEGGDMMMVAPKHLLVGFTSRTNHLAINGLVRLLLEQQLVEKVSVICLPHARDFMHIDTVFTQIKRGLWVLYGPFSKRGYAQLQLGIVTPELNPKESKKIVRIFQYSRGKKGIECTPFDFLDDLLTSVSKDDLGHPGPVEFIYCAGGQTSVEEREQWMDGCNFLALSEGVVLGYDRNHQTTASFEQRGFQVVDAVNVNRHMRAGAKLQELVKGDCLILLPSAELSRARGGSHCMSLPIARDSFSSF